MVERTMKNLIDTFKTGEKLDANYIFVVVEVSSKKQDIIINKMKDMKDKVKYYKKVYNEELNHKSHKGIKIIAFDYLYNFSELETRLKVLI